MKTILVWGTGSYCAMWHKWLMKYFKVNAFINNTPDFPATLKGIPVIKKEDVKKFDRDIIVIATDRMAEDSIRKDAASVGLEHEELINVQEFIKREHLEEKYEEDTVLKQIEVIKSILNAGDSEGFCFDWMYKKILEYGIFCYQKKWYEFPDYTEWNFYGLLQIPEEFADLCISICTLKIRTAIEIGVYRGRSSYFLCAVLMRNNSELRYDLVDIADRLDSFETFRSVLPSLKKAVPSTSEDYKGQAFDFVFIDADHSYDASIKDFENVGQYAKVITCFHDIYAHEYDDKNGGTVRMWKEVQNMTNGKCHRIFSKYPDQWMGIGCVVNVR